MESKDIFHDPVGVFRFAAHSGSTVLNIPLNGYVLHVDLAPVKEIISLRRCCANDLDQIAVRTNTYGGVYPDEIKVLQKDHSDLWGPLSGLLEKLSEVAAL